MQGSITNNGQKYAVFEHLQGRDKGFRFWSSNVPGMDQTKSRDEKGNEIIAYKIVWYTDSSDEAIEKCEEFHSSNEIMMHHHIGMISDMTSGLTARLDRMKKEIGDLDEMSQESTARTLIRDVTVAECPWLDRDFKKGEVVFEYLGYTYGVVSSTGRAYTVNNGETPFFELPNDAFEDILI